MAAGLIAEAASAAKLIFLWGFAWLTDLCLLTSVTVPAIVVIHIRFGTALASDMSSDFSGYGSGRDSEFSGYAGKGCACFKLLLKQDSLGECHLFVSRSDTSFPSGIQHSYFTTDPAQ